jgi:uncharacterized protein YqjF (DUF2071 family)
MTTGPKVFLTAEWKQLVMLNYMVDPGLLAPFVPAGTELDGCEGRTYVSLVGFQFNDTRVAGCAIPFHRSFEEVNLRFYVRCAEKRGVVFICELVPKIAIAATARLFYGEKYSRVPMAHRVHARPEKDVVEAEYSWGSGRQRCAMRIETVGNSFLPVDGSLSQFITEHYWGYAAQGDGGCIEYEVQHPRWTVRNAGAANFSGDAAHFYGGDFARVLMRPPDSAFLAEGSAVTVFRGRRIG